MKIKSILAVIVILLSSSIASGDNETIYIAADYNVYNLAGDSDNSYIEIYYSLFRSHLNFEPDSLGYISIMNFSIAIADPNGVVLDSVSWKAGARISSLSELKEKKNFMISDVITDSRPAGNYIVKISLENLGNIGSVTFPMEVQSFNTNDLAVSTLELAYEITPSEEGQIC